MMKQTKKDFLESITQDEVKGFFVAHFDLAGREMVFNEAVGEKDDEKQFHHIGDVDNEFSDMTDAIKAFMRATACGDADPSHDWFRTDTMGNVYTIGDINEYILDNFNEDMENFLRDEYQDELCEYYGYKAEEGDIS